MAALGGAFIGAVIAVVFCTIVAGSKKQNSGSVAFMFAVTIVIVAAALGGYIASDYHDTHYQKIEVDEPAEAE